MKKKIISLLLAVVMIVGMLPLGAISAFAENVPDSTGKYIARSWDSTKKQVVSTEEDIPETAQIITADTRELESGWYVLSESVTLPEGAHIIVNGDVNLVLCDGCELKIPSPGANCAGIELTDGGALASGDSLTVYGQKNGTGSIVATGGREAAGIGSDGENDCGDITIYGGTVTATGGSEAAGIGGGYEGDCGDIKIYGGTVTATGGNRGAGIGNGYEGNGGSITVYGGSVKAYGNNSRALGGDSSTFSKNKISIYGGDILADSKSSNDAVIAYSVKVYADADKKFTVKDLSGTELPFSPVTAEKDLYNDLTGYKAIHIADDTLPAVEYLNFLGNVAKCEKYTPVTQNTKNWSGGWYVVNENVTIDGDVTFSGTVELILCDGKTLTVNGDISGNGMFEIYAQSDGENMGKLNSGSITIQHIICIYGGFVSATATATGKPDAIRTENEIQINGGDVTATSAENASGIWAKNTIYINGDKVTVTGDKNGLYSEKSISINDGEVTVQGGTPLNAPRVNIDPIMAIYNRDNERVTDSVLEGSDLTETYYRIVHGSVQYRYYDEASGEFKNAECSDYEVIADSEGGYRNMPTEWEDGKWYVAERTIDYGKRITVTGDVHLILMEGCVLNNLEGINVSEGNTLTIYAQEEGSGILYAGNNINENAGIGGGANEDGGTVNIHGGIISAASGYGAGIGGGNTGNGGTVNIYDGVVTAESQYGAAIGGGNTGNGGTVNIYDGLEVYGKDGNLVTLPDGSSWGDMLNGIGYAEILVPVPYRYYDTESGQFKTGYCHNYTVVNLLHSDDVTLGGGDVTWHVIKGKLYKKHIEIIGNINLILTDGCELTVPGGVELSNGDSLTIYAQEGGSGVLNAGTNSEGSLSAGIGGGKGQNGGTVNIHGGIINAKGHRGAAIGGGAGTDPNKDGGSGCTLNIYGGYVHAIGNCGGAGIGGGCAGIDIAEFRGNGGGGAPADINIIGGTVIAEVYTDIGFVDGHAIKGTGAAIGGGCGGNHDGEHYIISRGERAVVSIGENMEVYDRANNLVEETNGWGNLLNGMDYVKIVEAGAQPIATPTADDFNFIPPANCVYNGQAKYASVTTDKEGMGVITLKYQKKNGGGWDSATTNAPTESGKYRVVISVEEGANYAASAGDITSDSWVFEIICQHNYIDYVCEHCGDVLLEDAKSDAIKAINDAEDHSEDIIVNLLAETARTAIDGAQSVAEVIATRNRYVAAIEKQLGATHEHTYSDKWSYNILVHWHEATCGHDVISGFAAHTFDEGVVNGNVTTYTCTECDYKKYVYNTAGDNEGEIIDGTSYTGISLTLGSDIAINFYMNLTDEAKEKGTMTFDIGGRIVTLKGTDAKWNSTEKKYYFSTPLTALEMAETVKATFTYNGIEYVQKYSVADYIDKIVGNPEKYGTEAAALARKIANYGYYAQIYLESIHTNVHIVDSGDGYDRMDKFENVDIDTQAAIEALAEYSVKVTGASDNLSLYGSTVYFDSATALNYYVTVKDGEKPSATAVNTVTGETKQVEIKHYKDDSYIVSVKDILATELADDIEVTVNGKLTLTGSVFAYCNSVVQAHNIDGATDKDIFAVNAMAAFYEYYEAAMEYISFELHFDIPEKYKVFTADGEEITGEKTVKCYRTFSFRLVPDDKYIISMVIAEGLRKPDENGLYTVSYVGGKHNVVVYTELDTYRLTVNVEGEDGGEMPDTKILFVYDSHESIEAQGWRPGIYKMDVPKGESGTIVITKSGYQEYRQEFTADGTVEEISVSLVPDSFSVTFDMMGHGEQISSQTVEKNGKITKPDNPIAEDKNFSGWYKDENCTVKWDFDTDTVTANTTLYAKWYEKVTGLEDGYYLLGEFGGSDIRMEVSDLLFDMRLTEIVTTGEYAVNWGFVPDDQFIIVHIQNGCINKYFYNSGDYYVIGASQGTVLKVVFCPDGYGNDIFIKVVPVSYMVLFDTMGHGIPEPHQVVYYGETATEPTDPVDEYGQYFFDGWYTDGYYTEKWDFNTPVTYELRLYAKWTPIQ